MTQNTNQINSGLINFGNNCYLNTVIQCLRFCPSMTQMFKDDKNDEIILLKTEKIKENKEISDDDRVYIDRAKVYFNLKKLLLELIQKSGNICPKQFILACLQLSKHTGMEYLFTEQNDIQECLAFVLDSVHECKAHSVNMVINCNESELEDVVDKIKYKALNTMKKYFEKRYSWVVGKFYYPVMCMTNCSKCNYATFSYDPHNMLCLPIPDGNSISLNDCLDHNFGDEVFGGDNCWKCDKCNNTEGNFRRYRMIDTPETLIINIKRFIPTMNGYKKNASNIDFPKILNISPYKFGGDKTKCTYKLFAVGNHIGMMSFGHCYAFCRDLKDENTWYCLNDTNVSKIDESQIYSDKAYVLFYQRIGD